MKSYDDLLDPGLIQLALEWETYPAPATPMSRVFLGPEPISRCQECDGMVYPDDFSGKLGHLLREHGYRMNGRQYDNQNQEI